LKLLNKERIQEDFLKLFPKGKFSFWKEIDSTQEAAANFPFDVPFLALAEKQREGIGRRERRWVSPVGGLWFTLSLPVKYVRRKKSISVLVGLAVKQALKKNLGLELKVKFPNDLLYNSMKLAGILVTAARFGKEIKKINIGVGMNVNNRAPLKTSVSLKEIMNKTMDAEEVLKIILTGIKEEICVK